MLSLSIGRHQKVVITMPGDAATGRKPPDHRKEMHRKKASSGVVKRTMLSVVSLPVGLPVAFILHHRKGSHRKIYYALLSPEAFRSLPFWWSGGFLPVAASGGVVITTL